MTSGIKFTGKKSKSPIATRAFKKRNGGPETSPSLSITPFVFNASNEEVVSGNKNGTKYVHRRAQNDLPLRVIF
jgi:hypothetical protein